jgi:hypothetical protein
MTALPLIVALACFIGMLLAVAVVVICVERMEEIDP